MTKCYICKYEILDGELTYETKDGEKCRACQIVQVFGSLQNFGKIARLGTNYEYSKEWLNF